MTLYVAVERLMIERRDAARAKYAEILLQHAASESVAPGVAQHLLDVIRDSKLGVVEIDRDAHAVLEDRRLHETLAEAEKESMAAAVTVEHLSQALAAAKRALKQAQGRQVGFVVRVRFRPVTVSLMDFARGRGHVSPA